MSKVWIYFSETGTGYEMSGSDIISGIDAFILKNGTYLIENSFSDMKQDMHFFIYEWDRAQKNRRTIFEGYQRQTILLGFAKSVNLTHDEKQEIYKMYSTDEED